MNINRLTLMVSANLAILALLVFTLPEQPLCNGPSIGNSRHSVKCWGDMKTVVTPGHPMKQSFSKSKKKIIR